MASSLFIFDVKEKQTSEAKPPSFPQIKSSTSGFPEHKKRGKPSAFKQKRQGIQPEEPKKEVFFSSNDQPLSALQHDPRAAPSNESFNTSEKSSIARENDQKLASMSPQEIEQARQELFNGLDPSILEMLLKRANLDDGANSLPFDQPQPTTTSSKSERADIPQAEDTSVKAASSLLPEKNTPQSGATSTKKRVQWAQPDTSPEVITTPETHDPAAATITTTCNDDDDSGPTIPPAEHIIDPTTLPEHEGAHWPRAPQPADLDPSDPNFLQNLHEKYFPSLPTDPSKLAWMAPVPTPNSTADRESPYYPGQDSLPVSALRFDFRGALLPPRISRAVPMSKGLHHHGEAPEAAGYTIRELARLARSAVPGQRCIAYQTLGRILYRLGDGSFGGVGPDDVVSMGIWREVEEGAVLRSLHDEIGGGAGEAGSRGRGHRSASMYATEAIWLFEKGGWKTKLRKAR